MNETETEEVGSLYHRQESLELNTDQTVVVVGAGGIGFHVTKMLAMAGIKSIFVFDTDIFEEHNLNRIDCPTECIGVNKADVVRSFVEQMRPDCKIKSFPYQFATEFVDINQIDWIIDCTDVHEAQLKHQGIADQYKIKYFKAGYNGLSISINNRVAEWDVGETPDGYTVTPSYVAPAVVISALAVHKVLTDTENKLEMGGTIDTLFA